MPTKLLVQARLAARSGVRLDTVLRRYFAGYTLFGDYVVQEANRDLDGAELKAILKTQGALFDRLVVGITGEYERERAGRIDSPEERRVKRVRRLLDGELLDPSSLAYPFEGWHLGAVAVGAEAAQALRALGERLDCRLLLVQPGEEVAWAWLGGRRPAVTAEVVSVAEAWPASVRGGLGEPCHGMTGWRLTHGQATAALAVARRGPDRLAAYADVALLASTLRDDVLSSSLRQLYLEPLAQTPDGGETSRKTLRAYFDAGGNVSSAAAALGVSRQTVSSRLRAIEERLDRTLESCALEMRLALQLEGRAEFNISAQPPILPGRRLS